MVRHSDGIRRIRTAKGVSVFLAAADANPRPPPAAGLLLLLQRLQFCIAQNRRGRLAMRRSLTAKEPCCCDRRCWGTGVSPAPLQGSQRDKGNGLVAGVSGRRAATAIEDEHHMYL